MNTPNQRILLAHPSGTSNSCGRSSTGASTLSIPALSSALPSAPGGERCDVYLSGGTYSTGSSSGGTPPLSMPAPAPRCFLNTQRRPRNQPPASRESAATVAPTPTPTAAPVDKLELVAAGWSVVGGGVEDVVDDENEVNIGGVVAEAVEDCAVLLDDVPATALAMVKMSVAESVSRVSSSQTAMENRGETERSLVVFTVQV